MSKTIEETYQKKTPIEHILLRPDTYIGSIEKETQQMYVWDDESSKMVLRTISFVPGLYKIFDEIIVNAADNKIRDPKMTTIKVTIDPENNEISVYNNGRGVPIRIHNKENVYVPELIFGNLLTSSNYNDNEKKVTGGRNGYGAKLCNIFSNEFIVETADCEVKRKYKQVYHKNMSIKGEPEIERYTGEDYTRITFKPDLKRFKMSNLDEDIVSLLKKRVYDLSGVVKNVKVFLNDKKIEVSNFKQYVKLYLPEDAKIVHQIINERWELAFNVSEEQFQQISFVNSISTTKGGTHVNHVVDQVIDPLIEAIKKKDKNLIVKPFQVKSSMFIFVNCLIDNPSFDSQTKENLTLRISAFGSKCEPLTDFIKQIIKNTEILDRVTAFAKAKQSQQLKKSDGAKISRLIGIPKLEDANCAGGAKSKDCTLILTEGDSAKTLAVAGLGVVGRDLYGVFPLRGKLLNVREATHKQIMENAEISNIKKILGLQQNKIYEDTSSLRYGHIMIMTDQDHDGSHIKGLIINFLDYFFPSLLKVPNFLQEFITPIIRATKRGVVKDFFTIPEFEEFIKNETGWNIKYYKGLGTSTSADAKQYFSDLDKHVKSFTPLVAEDKDLIDLAFNKKKADNRKTWLYNFVPGTFLDQSRSRISISDFVNKELILFSMADNIRSIPSVIDGLKPGQRKVLFSCFKKKLTSEMKVAQLVGYVSEQSAYHHGEQSLCSTIVNLAQDFVGSNNINLLLPLGQFGSRLQGGKDSASPRYIFTALSPLARLIFPESDDSIVTYLNEENMSIEPEFYVPIIPMVLVNGPEGIGTGWSSNIPNYNPLDIVHNLRRMMKNEEPLEMTPFYRNFRGSVEKIGDGRYQFSGLVAAGQGASTAAISSGSLAGEIEIVELPIGTWTQTYKDFLESLLQSGEIRDLKEYHTDMAVRFVIKVARDVSNWKLSTTLSTNNMVCFDANHRIKKYATPEEILKDFNYVRLKYYSMRKDKILEVLRDILLRLENKKRFITEVVEDQLIINKRKRGEIVADLDARGYTRFDDYEYLLSMQILSLTRERIEKLVEEYKARKTDYETLLRKTPKDLWEEDLSVFERAYKEMVEKERKTYDEEVATSLKKSGRKNTRTVISVLGSNGKSKDSPKTVTAKKTTDKVTKTKKVKELKDLSDSTVKKTKAGKPAASKKQKGAPKEEPKVKKVKVEAKPVIISQENPVVDTSNLRINIVESDTDDGEKPWEKYNFGSTQ